MIAGTARTAVAPPVATSVHSGADATARVAVPTPQVPEAAPNQVARRRARRFFRRSLAVGSRHRRAACTAASVTSRNTAAAGAVVIPVRARPGTSMAVARFWQVGYYQVVPAAFGG